MSPNTDFSDMQSRNEQTLTDIQGLQTIEQELFTQLNTGLTQKTLTPAQQNSIIAKINDVSQMRINLYKNLDSVYSFFGKNAASSNAALAEQTVAIGVVEQELNSAKERISDIQNDANNTMRQIQINTYYGEKYSYHTEILKKIILFCIPVLLLSILYKADLIPSSIYSVLIVIVIVWGCISVGYQIINALYRDNMNYNEYNWHFDKSTAPPNNTSDSGNGSDPWGGALSIACLGQNCCYEGTTYNDTLSQCVPNDVAASMAATAATAAAAATAADTGAAAGGEGGSGWGSHFQLPQGGFGGL